MTSKPEPRYEFYQEVQVRTSDPKKSHLNGRIGVVFGRTETSENTSWGYGVQLQDKCWFFYEYEIQPTGRQFRREDFYDGSSVRVRVDENGRGNLA